MNGVLGGLLFLALIHWRGVLCQHRCRLPLKNLSTKARLLKPKPMAEEDGNRRSLFRDKTYTSHMGLFFSFFFIRKCL